MFVLVSGPFLAYFIPDAIRYTSFLQSASLPKVQQWLDLPHCVRGEALHFFFTGIVILITQLSEMCRSQVAEVRILVEVVLIRIERQLLSNHHRMFCLQ